MDLEALKLYVLSLETLAHLDQRDLDQTQEAMRKADAARQDNVYIDPWLRDMTRRHNS